MITTHQYLACYPIDPVSEKLIVGTIHPHDHTAFDVPFFYGNQCSLWKILHAAFPEELTDPHSLPAILGFLRQRKVAISDMIWECERISPSALDENLIPLRLNEDLLDQIRHSHIREVLFTSGFGKNAAFRLFYVNVLKRRLTANIRKQREIVLESQLFGRPVRLRALYSPSGTANTGLVNSVGYRENRQRYSHLPTPVQAFKIDYYRKIFNEND